LEKETTMVITTPEGVPQKPDRRMGLRMLGSTWRNSWRNSDRTLESRDGSCSRRNLFVDDGPRKNVHFPEEVVRQVIEIPRIDKAETPQDVEDRWYDLEDYVKFEKDRMLTSYGYVASKRAGTSTFDVEKYSLRGLEILTDEKLSKRLNCDKQALKTAVKEEEERQKAENCFPDLLKFRRVSLKYTKSSSDRALAVAQDDAKSVGREVKDDFLSPLPRLRQMYSDLGSRQSARKLV